MEMQDEFQHADLFLDRGYASTLSVRSVAEILRGSGVTFPKPTLFIGEGVGPASFTICERRLSSLRSSMAWLRIFSNPCQLFTPPLADIVQIFAVTVQPVDGWEVTRRTTMIYQRPETADKAFGMLGDRLGKVTARRGYRARWLQNRYGHSWFQHSRRVRKFRQTSRQICRIAFFAGISSKRPENFAQRFQPNRRLNRPSTPRDIPYRGNIPRW